MRPLLLAGVVRALLFATLACVALCVPHGGAWVEIEANRARNEEIRQRELVPETSRARVLEVLGVPTKEDAEGQHHDTGMHWLGVDLDERGCVRESSLVPY